MIKVLFICHGNICRSTMAESLFTHLVATRGIADQFEIDSAATSREEIGNGPHWGTRDKLAKEGIPLVPHRARQMNRDDYLYYDYLIGMDSANMRNMLRLAGAEESRGSVQSHLEQRKIEPLSQIPIPSYDTKGKIYKLLSFAGSTADVADPWYTGDFDATYRDVLAGCEGLLDYLATLNPRP